MARKSSTKTSARPDDPPRSATHPPPRPPLSRKKRFVFAILALVLSVAFVLLVEASLRSFGWGGYPPTIVKAGRTADGDVCIVDTPGPASYFYTSRSKPGSINQFDFLTPKPAGVVRIFLAGGSAMKGFPEPMAFTPAAFLTEMLQDVWPGRRVEVINLGTTAVASFPVLGMITEALDYQPDLVVLHTGHNEFYGAFGVASLHSAGNRPWAIAANRWLRGAAIVQAVDRLVSGGPAGAPDKTLMEVMIGQDYIAPDSPLRAAAARNLGHHVRTAIERCRAHGVPVMVCTQPSNERDLAPLGTEKLDTLAADQQERVVQLLASAESKITAAPGAAAQDLEALLALYPDHARAHYLLGKSLLATAQPEVAAEHFRRAIDLDPMPWRAPSLSIDAVVAAAKDERAWLCDARQFFRDASPSGCIGWELLDDHVHPTLAGQAMLARAIVERLTHVEGPLAVSRAAYEKLASNEAYARRLGDNVYERYAVACTLLQLYKIPFFEKTNPDALSRFSRLITDTEAGMPSEVLSAARRWRDRKTHAGALRPISSLVGRVFIRMGRFGDAEPLYDVARRCVARYSSWNLEYVYFQLACREKLHGKLSDEDRRMAEDAVARATILLASGHSRSGMAERYAGRLHQLLGHWQEAIPLLLAARAKVSGTDLVATDEALIISFLKTNRRPEALRLIEDGIAHSGEYAHLYKTMKQALPPGP